MSADLPAEVSAQELVGHRDVATTMVYTHVLNRGGRGVRRDRSLGPALVMVVAIGCGQPVSELPAPPPLAQPCAPPPAPGDFVRLHRRLALPLSPAEAEQFRAALEDRYQGMAGLGASVGLAPTVSVIEAATLEEAKKAGACPQVPFGSREDWIAFKTLIAAGDRVVYFRNNDERWRVQAGAEGYAIVRGGKVIGSFLLAMN